MTTKYVQASRALLQSGIDASQTSCTVTELLDLSGNPITQSDIGDECHATFEPNTAREEAVSFTIDSNTAGTAVLTLTRGLRGKAPYGTGGTGFAHDAGSELVISNNPSLFNKLTAKDNDEEVTGAWKFPANPTHDQNPVPKKYLEDNAVMKTGNQTVAGEKTFFTAPVIPAADGDDTPYQKQEVDALDAENMKLTGDQTIAGEKTFSTSPKVPDATADDEPLTRGQFNTATESAGAIASDTVRGTTKLDTAADDVNDPKALTATEERVNFISATTGMISLYAGSSAPTGFLLCDGSAVSRTTYADLFAVTGTAYGSGDGSTTFNVPDLRSSFPVGLGQKTKAFTFEDADVNTTTNVITVDSNDFIQTGTELVLSNSGGALPTGLSATTYYAIRVSATTIKLATSRANADDDTEVDITAASGGGTHTLTLTLTDRSLGDEGGEETHQITTDEMASHHHTLQYHSENGSGFPDSQGADLVGNFNTSTEGGDIPHNNMPPYVTVNYIIKT